MRYPSIRTLSEIFDDAKTARGIIAGSIDPCVASDAARKRELECFTLAPMLTLKLCALDELGGFFGVESFEYSDGFVEYLNAGDTYAATLLYRPDLRDRWQVSTLGDVVETLERKGYKVP